jgi:hypothetical protein
MAWEYGTDWVAGFLAGEMRYVTGLPPANVGLWPIPPLTHSESDESGEEEEGNDERTLEAAGTQGITAPSGPVMAAPSIAPSVVATAVPTIPTVQTAASTIPTPRCRPRISGNNTFYGANNPAHGRGGQHQNNHMGIVAPRTAPYHRRAPPKTGRHGGSRYAADTAARGWRGTNRPNRDKLAAEGSQADQQWEQARAEVQRLWTFGQQLRGKAQTKSTYAGFREVVKMAQDALEAADASSWQAREERMASVGALPMMGLQLRGAPKVIEPS